MNAQDDVTLPRARTHTITTCTPIKPHLARLVRLMLFLAQTFPVVQGMAQFRAIHFTRWSVISRIPDNGQPQLREHLSRPLLLWETYYNGDMHQYIEAFSCVIPGQINRTWHTSYGFPGASPITPLTSYIDSVQFPPTYYYSAYPVGSVRMIDCALRLTDEHANLMALARASDPDEFAAAYDRFLERHQGDL